MGKLTISMAIFNSYATNDQRVQPAYFFMGILYGISNHEA